MNYPISKTTKEFIDEDRYQTSMKYYDVLEIYQSSGGTESVREKLGELIKEDSDFLDPYLLLAELISKSDPRESEELTETAQQRALGLLRDNKGTGSGVRCMQLLSRQTTSPCCVI